MKADPLVVVLQEYEERDIHLTLAQAQTLRRLCRDRLMLQPGDAPHRWRLKASSHVGTIVTPDVRVLIRPKVSIVNLFYLLEADGQPLAVDEAIFEYQRTSDLIPSFAMFFARHLDTALGKGVPRSYVELEQRTMGVRGRISLSAQRRRAGLALPLECRFDEYTADIPLNRILRAATVRLLCLPGVAVATRGRLRRHAGGLDEAADLRATDLQTRIAFTRLTPHCRPTEQLARVVLGGSSLLDDVGVYFEASDEASPESGPHEVLEHPVHVEQEYGRSRAVDQEAFPQIQRSGVGVELVVVSRPAEASLRTWLVRLDETPAAIEGELRCLAEEIRQGGEP